MKKIAIVVSGGPAPGINSVISSVTIDALNEGFEVVGLVNGYELAAKGERDALLPLTVEMVSQLHGTGGSFLGTSRLNPFSKPEFASNFLRTITNAGITDFVAIGGDGSAYLSTLVAAKLPQLRVIHLPKTIDNDLPLPHNYPSFGFETARQRGTDILETLIVDARTTKRWFLVTTMGRRAGFLALGLGIASGATMTLIPEEFADRPVTPRKIAHMIFDTIKLRANQGKDFGLVIMAEGLLDCLTPEGTPELEGCPRDDLGRIRYSNIELSDIVARPLRELVEQEGLKSKFTTKNIGYELRCARPVSFDVEYTRSLGYGAVKHICDNRSEVMVTRDFDNIGALPFSEMIGPDGFIKSRRVDIESDLYKVARSFMIRDRSDLGLHKRL